MTVNNHNYINNTNNYPSPLIIEHEKDHDICRLIDPEEKLFDLNLV
jgi:hypothetical protein